VFGEAESEKSNGITMTMRPILFPDEVCSVNQTLLAASRATDCGPEAVEGSGYSENLEVVCGLIVVVVGEITFTLGVLKLLVGLPSVNVETWLNAPGQGDTPVEVPPVSVHSEVLTNWKFGAPLVVSTLATFPLLYSVNQATPRPVSHITLVALACDVAIGKSATVLVWFLRIEIRFAWSLILLKITFPPESMAMPLGW
jgi:hypothetical protein